MNVPELRSSLIHWLKFHFGQFSLFSNQGNGILCHVVHIKQDSFRRDIFHFNVIDKDIFNDTTASSCRLKPEPDIRAYKCAVAHIDIACTSAHLAPDHETTMSSIDCAAPNRNVF